MIGLILILILIQPLDAGVRLRHAEAAVQGPVALLLKSFVQVLYASRMSKSCVVCLSLTSIHKSILYKSCAEAAVQRPVALLLRAIDEGEIDWLSLAKEMIDWLI